ncbi:MAG TPA: glycosyltransferase family 39 protein [Gaiella sp.]|jgi:4-amino-4-deoxy-L-arabinose transferase-like glycosyltransferase|nr:glycosyltransferase family 39 protein [Gaiella sp.]
MGRGRSRVAWFLVLPVAAAEFLLLVATSNRYGYHRDELYFRVAARHLAWGYDDQPPLTPLLGRFSEWMFGADPRGLRLLSAVAMALVVVLVALIARELGAGEAGQALAALATAASAAVMAVGHLLSTTTFDVLIWMTVVYIVVRILGDGDERLWLLVGLVVGIGLENKQLVLLLVVALASGCLLSRRWDLARSPWLWMGAALAVAVWLPNLVWQARHGWPQLELARKIAEEDAAGNRVELIPLQFLLIGPLLAPLWLSGLWWLLRGTEARPYRPIGLAYVVLLVIALVTGAKPYYTMGLLLALLAAGGVVAEGWWRARRPRKLALGFTIALSAAVAALITLPLVPVAKVHATPIPDVNEDAIETIGWLTFAATVGRVWNELPQQQRSTAVVYTSNYGEAGAIARYGHAHGLPRAYSGHNAFWRFGRPPDGARPIIVVGYNHPETLRIDFSGCVLAARIDNGVSLENEEQGAPIWICATTTEAWSKLWPRLRSLNP